METASFSLLVCQSNLSLCDEFQKSPQNIEVVKAERSSMKKKIVLASGNKRVQMSQSRYGKGFIGFVE